MAKNAIRGVVKRISNILVPERKKSNVQTFEYLITGPPRSGKTTLFQQLKRFFENDGKIAENLRLQRREDIRRYVSDSITAILTDYVITLPLSSLKILAVTEWLKHNLKKPGCFEERSDLPKKFFNLPNFFNYLWQDKEVKSSILFHIYNKCHSNDNLEYFFDKIEIIFNNDYVPTEEDVLRCPFFASDVEEIKIHRDNYVYRFIDTGSSTEYERRLMKYLRWTKRNFKTSHKQRVIYTVICLLDCSSPDQLDLSFIKLRNFICSSHILQYRIYVVLNKVDVFKKRNVFGGSVKSFFSDWSRGCVRPCTIVNRNFDMSSGRESEEGRILCRQVVGIEECIIHVLEHDYNFHCRPIFDLICEFGLNGYSCIDVTNYLDIRRLLQSDLFPNHMICE